MDTITNVSAYTYEEIARARAAVLHFRRQAKTAKDNIEYVDRQAAGVHTTAVVSKFEDISEIAAEYRDQLTYLDRKTTDIYNQLETDRREVLQAKKNPEDVEPNAMYYVKARAEHTYDPLKGIAGAVKELHDKVQVLKQTITERQGAAA